MIPVEEAVRRIESSVAPLEAERVPLTDAFGRVLAHDAIARVDQPPAPVSAMDGYAVRSSDTQSVPVTLRVIGAAPAGHPFSGIVGAGEAVRIFTGGVVPAGADAIVIQENAQAAHEGVVIRAAGTSRHIRAAGLDFRSGTVLATGGKRLNARDLALLAAGDLASVDVRRKPRVAFAATGDELSWPGEARGAGGIVASSGYALGALIARWGGEAADLGILPDTVEALQGIADAADVADIIVTMGGASVGDHDLVQRALAPMGFVLDFWKIAMRPGKPLIFGRLRERPFLGLPGNPVSSFVCALLFLRPLIARMLGTVLEDIGLSARLAVALPPNDSRQDYLRARLFRRDGELWIEPFVLQDSSMQSALAAADALVVRAPHAPEARAGEQVEALSLAEC